MPLVAFPDIDKTYSSDNLFPVFSSRLPDKRRRGIEKILVKYGLREYDEYELLKRSEARLPIDMLSFIKPIFPDDEQIDIEFWAMGIRYYIGCDGKTCEKALVLQEGQKIVLKPEPENKYDKHAVRLMSGEELVGYLPRYYCHAILAKLAMGTSYDCRVKTFYKENDCQECLRIYLKLPHGNNE